MAPDRDLLGSRQAWKRRDCLFALLLVPVAGLVGRGALDYSRAHSLRSELRVLAGQYRDRDRHGEGPAAHGAVA